MNRGSIGRRLTKLEAARLVEPVILHFEDGNKTPMTIAGTAKNFFRLVSAMGEYGRPGAVLQGALLELDLLRRAARIEGGSGELFSLVQALIRGPVPDDPEPQL